MTPHKIPQCDDSPAMEITPFYWPDKCAMLLEMDEIRATLRAIKAGEEAANSEVYRRINRFVRKHFVQPAITGDLNECEPRIVDLLFNISMLQWNNAPCYFLSSQVDRKHAEARAMDEKADSTRRESITLLKKRSSLQDRCLEKHTSLVKELNKKLTFLNETMEANGSTDEHKQRWLDVKRQNHRVEELDRSYRLLREEIDLVAEIKAVKSANADAHYEEAENLRLAAKAQNDRKEAILSAGQEMLDTAPFLKKGNTIQEMADYAQSMLDQDNRTGFGNDNDEDDGSDLPKRSVKRRLEY